eukprot:gene27677-34164_t
MDKLRSALSEKEQALMAASAKIAELEFTLQTKSAQLEGSLREAGMGSQYAGKLENEATQIQNENAWLREENQSKDNDLVNAAALMKKFSQQATSKLQALEKELEEQVAVNQGMAKDPGCANPSFLFQSQIRKQVEDLESKIASRVFAWTESESVLAEKVGRMEASLREGSDAQESSFQKLRASLEELEAGSRKHEAAQSSALEQHRARSKDELRAASMEAQAELDALRTKLEDLEHHEAANEHLNWKVDELRGSMQEQGACNCMLWNMGLVTVACTGICNMMDQVACNCICDMMDQ